MADDTNYLRQVRQQGAPLMQRPGLRGEPPNYSPYEYMDSTDPLAASRIGLEVMRALGYGNPLGVVPGSASIASDLYGATNPAHQSAMTERTRQWLLQNQRRDNAGDAQNQPGGFYGRRR